VAALLMLAAPVSWSATVNLNSGDEMEFTYQAVATTPGNYSLITADDYVLAVPGQYSFDGNFNASQAALPYLSSLSSVGPYTFQDSYAFVITQSATGNVLTASLQLGSAFDISNLQMRIYKVVGSPTLPVIGSLGSLISSGDVELVTGWIGPSSGQSSVVAAFNNISSGSYLLDIAGTAVGQFGGSYVGTLNLQPVPVPAAFWLLCSGLGAMGAATRHRRAMQA
jgi:hypothetical protein